MGDPYDEKLIRRLLPSDLLLETLICYKHEITKKLIIKKNYLKGGVSVTVWLSFLRWFASPGK